MTFGHDTHALLLAESEALQEMGEMFMKHIDAHEKLQSQLNVALEALQYYAKHGSVIAEAYHSNDEKQITCVHTFINHKAIEALEKIGCEA